MLCPFPPCKIALTGKNQLVGRIVVKTDQGVGCRADVEKEVVLTGVAFFGDGLVEQRSLKALVLP